jgi:hypothetical protein
MLVFPCGKIFPSKFFQQTVDAKSHSASQYQHSALPMSLPSRFATKCFIMADSKRIISKCITDAVSVLQCLRHNRRAVAIWAAVCIVLTGALWGGMQREIQARKAEARNNAARRGASL